MHSAVKLSLPEQQRCTCVEELPERKCSRECRAVQLQNERYKSIFKWLTYM